MFKFRDAVPFPADLSPCTVVPRGPVKLTSPATAALETMALNETAAVVIARTLCDLVMVGFLLWLMTTNEVGCLPPSLRFTSAKGTPYVQRRFFFSE